VPSSLAGTSIRLWIERPESNRDSGWFFCKVVILILCLDPTFECGSDETATGEERFPVMVLTLTPHGYAPASLEGTARFKHNFTGMIVTARQPLSCGSNVITKACLVSFSVRETIASASQSFTVPPSLLLKRSIAALDQTPRLESC